jgi:hypothetical protein
MHEKFFLSQRDFNMQLQRIVSKRIALSRENFPAFAREKSTITPRN